MTIMAERIAATLASLRPVGGQRPWPRFEVDHQAWNAIGDAIGQGGGDLLGLWAHGQQVHMALRAPSLPQPAVVSVALRYGAFPTLATKHPPADRLERTVHDLHGIQTFGRAELRPWLDHGQWGVWAPLGANGRADRRDPADYPFLPVRGEGLHEIPVGPVHAGIIEPGHFRFAANGEAVVRLEERLGYTHKGIDGLLGNVPPERAAAVIGRVSGDSTVAYAFAFARAVEAALEVAPPPRAQVLRGVMAELERIANHLGDVGAICNDAAFTLIHAHCGILREQVLQACDAAFGHRLMMDRICPGGVAQDLSPEGSAGILAMLDEIAPAFARIVQLYDETPSLQDRTCTTGVVRKELAARWGAGGHVGRASGRNFDTRRDLPYPPYDGAAFDVPVFEAGDVDARVWVRIREVEASVALLRTWLAALPEGDIRAPLGRAGDAREGIAMVEAFRGDVLVWVRLHASGIVERAHARDASVFQWPLLEAAIEGNIVADFPLCNKSFNCSYSGHDV
jgi:Ni,Fe-hydrogenase III large subunit